MTPRTLLKAAIALFTFTGKLLAVATERYEKAIDENIDAVIAENDRHIQARKAEKARHRVVTTELDAAFQELSEEKQRAQRIHDRIQGLIE